MLNILEALSDFETNVRGIQTNLNSAKNIINRNTKSTLDLPSDVYSLKSFRDAISQDKEKAMRLLKSFPGYLLSLIHYDAINENDIKIISYIRKEFLVSFKGTITLTFGDVAESHVGMQKIGKMAKNGFSFKNIKTAERYFVSKGCETLIIHLNDFLPNRDRGDGQEHLDIAKKDSEFQAYILVARNGLKCLGVEDQTLLTEMMFFEWDAKFYNERRGIVQNKLARHNLNFSDQEQIADFSKGKGTTILWENAPIVNSIRKKLVKAVGPAAEGLKCEGNKYYDSSKTGIGYHGDSERRKVIGIRLGKSMDMHWMWYYDGVPKGTNVSVTLNSGDVYFMSEKAVGTDWRPKLSEGWKKKRYTLRHAAGAKQYTTKTQGATKVQIINQRSYSENSDITIGDIQYLKKKSEANPIPDWITAEL